VRRFDERELDRRRVSKRKRSKARQGERPGSEIEELQLAAIFDADQELFEAGPK